MRLLIADCSKRQLLSFLKRRFYKHSARELLSAIQVEPVHQTTALILCRHNADEVDRTGTCLHELRGLVEQLIELPPVEAVATRIEFEICLDTKHDLPLRAPDLPFVPIGHNRRVVVRAEHQVAPFAIELRVAAAMASLALEYRSPPHSYTAVSNTTMSYPLSIASVSESLGSGG